MNKKLQLYCFQVPVVGVQNYFVKTSSREEAIEKIYLNDKSVESELDDIDWNLAWNIKDIKRYIAENIDEA